MSLADLLVLLVFGFIAVSGVILPWLRRQQDRPDEARRKDGTPEGARVAAAAAQSGSAQTGRDPERSREEPRAAADRREATTTQPRSIRSGRGGRESAAAEARDTGAPAAAALGQQLRRSSPVGSLGEARRGFVLMTVLGPCRAVEPYAAPQLPNSRSAT
jgi:hypothetical protein